MSYVGHSMGCAVLFIAMTYHPELNSKIDVMFALAPGAANGHAKTDIRIRAPFLNPAMVWVALEHLLCVRYWWAFILYYLILKAFHKLIGTTVVRPVDSFYQNLQKSFCGPNMLFRYSFCYNEAFRLAGDSYKGLDLVYIKATSLFAFIHLYVLYMANVLTFPHRISCRWLTDISHQEHQLWQ